MKKVAFIILSTLIIVCSFGQTKDAAYYRSKGYQVFSQFGVAVKAPIQLQDVSRRAEGDFALNYAGLVDENKPTVAFYQFIVSSLPVGYRNYTENQLQVVVGEFIKSMTSSFTNVKKVYFGDEECIGYVGDTKTNGYNQRGLIFYRKGHIYALTVVTNYQLEQRFNKFTNGVKFFDNSPTTPMTTRNQNTTLSGLSNPSTNTKTYSCTHFSIKYPLAWIIDVQGNPNATNSSLTDAAVVIKVNNTGTRQPTRNLSINMDPCIDWSNMSSSDIKLAMKTSVRNQYPYARFISEPTYVTKFGLSGYKLEYTANLGYFTAKFVQYILHKSDGFTYFISLVVENDKADSQLSELSKILETFVPN